MIRPMWAQRTLGVALCAIGFVLAIPSWAFMFFSTIGSAELAINAAGVLLVGWGVVLLLAPRVRRWAVYYMIFASLVIPLTAGWMIHVLWCHGTCT